MIIKSVTRRKLLGLIAGAAAVSTAPTLMGREAVKAYAITFPPDAKPDRVSAVLQRVKDDGLQLWEYNGMRLFPVYHSKTVQPTGEYMAYVLL